jgi:hypothetical protein
MTWNYWVIYREQYSDPQNPDGLLRQRPGASRYDAETLNRYGTWDPSDLPARIWLGKEYDELQPVTRDIAVAHARRWMVTGGWITLPDDLTDDLTDEATDDATDHATDEDPAPPLPPR